MATDAPSTVDPASTSNPENVLSSPLSSVSSSPSIGPATLTSSGYQESSAIGTTPLNQGQFASDMEDTTAPPSTSSANGPSSPLSEHDEAPPVPNPTPSLSDDDVMGDDLMDDDLMDDDISSINDGVSEISDTTDFPAAYDEDGNPTDPNVFIRLLQHPGQLSTDELYNTAALAAKVLKVWQDEWIELEQEVARAKGVWARNPQKEHPIALEDQKEAILYGFDYNRRRSRRGRQKPLIRPLKRTMYTDDEMEGAP